MRHKRLIIDGTNLAHRARHAYSRMRDDSGRRTGVLYGVTNALISLIDMFTPDEVIVAWEGKGMPWRRTMDNTYKAQRRADRDRYTVEEQEELQAFYDVQLPDAMTALRNLGVPQLHIPTMEADDVIAYIAFKLSFDGIENIIVSTDKDFLQLVRHGTVRVFNPITERMFFCKGDGTLHESHKELSFIAPSATVYLWRKFLIGDSSDSIIGVPGVGKVTASKLMNVASFPRESVLAYLNRILPETDLSAREVSIKNSMGDGTLLRSYHLMSLRYAVKAHPKALSKLVPMYNRSWKPVFIREGIEARHPNHLTIFFGARGFHEIYDEGKRQRLVDAFRSVYVGHKKMKRIVTMRK